MANAKKTAKKTAKKAAKKAAKKTAKTSSRAESAEAEVPKAKRQSKKAAKKAPKVAAKKAAKKTAKVSTKAESPRVTESRMEGYRRRTVEETPEGTVVILETRTRTSGLTPNAKMALGVGVVAAVTAGITLLVARVAKASGPASSDTPDTPATQPKGRGPLKWPAPSEAKSAGSVDLPPEIPMGTIPGPYTRIYQLFDTFVEDSSYFFANLGDSESANNLYAQNPAGEVLSRNSIIRQMKSPTYGEEWNSGCASSASEFSSIPFTKYLDPEGAKKLGAIGIFQGIAGSLGQAGRRCGTAILAPLPVDRWLEPGLQLAAFMELFGALYRNYGAIDPLTMRIAWGMPGKAKKPNDPYYISRKAKWEARQDTTGLHITEFGKMKLFSYSVDEVVKFFTQFDYSPVAGQRSAVRMSLMARPFKRKGIERQLASIHEHPAYVGADLDE